MKYRYSYKRDKVDARDIKFSITTSLMDKATLPMSVDLRPKCPSIYDQGSLGSCTANAGCTCRIMLLSNPAIELSRLFLYYVERKLDGDVQEDSGASLRDTCKSIYKTGVCEEKYMPYDTTKFSKSPSVKAVRNAGNYKITSYQSLDTLAEIKHNLAVRGQPVLLGMDVYESFESGKVVETGMMNLPMKNEKLIGGHAVLVVGYKDSPKNKGFFIKNKTHLGHLIVRNSWGSDWGDKGYFYMPYTYVTPKYTYDYWIMEY